MIVAHDLFFPAHGITNQVILGFGQLNSSINNMNANMTVGFQELNTNINTMRADVVHRLVSLENRLVQVGAIAQGNVAPITDPTTFGLF